ncbi:MAG: hypothetical protein HND53_06110 [Proteobacteria bacterium]|nr:hypothetical protein [Pseudomonadota bacterium]
MKLNKNKILDDFYTVIDCEHKTAPTQEVGIPLIRTPNIGKGILILDNVKRVTDKIYDIWTKRAKPFEDDLIMAREAPVGNVAIIQKGEKVCLGQRTVLIRNKNVGLLPKYFNYLLNSEAMNAYLNILSNGATVGHLNVSDIRKLALPEFPTVDIQEKIAAILITYDDLIQNNKKRIALLENMTEEIYREWFVRFRFPGFQKVKFEKGIPKEWDKKTFREIVSYYIGGGWGEESQTSIFNEGAYVIRGTDIPGLNSGVISRDVYRYHKPSNLESRKLKVNDFIFEVSGGSKDQLLGRNLHITENLHHYFEENVMCASFCKQIRFNLDLVSPYFMRYYLKLYYDCDLVGIYQVQSTGISNYQFESFLNYQTIVLPPKELREKFDQLVKPLINEKDNLALANSKLLQSRNMLLPRLISGKLSVEDLDIQFPPSMLEEEEVA